MKNIRRITLIREALDELLDYESLRLTKEMDDNDYDETEEKILDLKALLYEYNHMLELESELISMNIKTEEK